MKYDPNLGGYVIGLNETGLKGAPKYANESAWDWADPGTARSIDDYYANPRLS